jgi:hypothetical protein
MDTVKYIGMDVHKEAISIAVLNSSGKLVMECIIETKAATILQFFRGLRGSLHVTFEEGTWATWLYDLLKPHVTITAETLSPTFSFISSALRLVITLSIRFSPARMTT